MQTYIAINVVYQRRGPEGSDWRRGCPAARFVVHGATSHNKGDPIANMGLVTS